MLQISSLAMQKYAIETGKLGVKLLQFLATLPKSSCIKITALQQRISGSVIFLNVRSSYISLCCFHQSEYTSLIPRP